MTQINRPGVIQQIALFVVLACALAWLIALPLWLGQGLKSPATGVVLPLMMFAPSIAALIVVFFVEKPSSKVRALGLMPLKPLGRLITYVALGLVIPILLCLVALLIGAALDVYPADFVHFSGFNELVTKQLTQSGVTNMPIPIGVMVALQFVNIVIASFTLNLIPALGEELGWRGWLLPKLLRLGPWPAIIISGIIWGLWHAPVILLGYNYPDAPRWLGLAAMTCMCTLVGGILGWLRLRGGSVWPPAVAHASLNASAGLVLVFIQAGKPFDALQTNITGWSGWIVPGLVVIAIVVSGKFRPKPVAPSQLKPDVRAGSHGE